MADAGNTIELLLWSRGRGLDEVRRRIRELLDQGDRDMARERLMTITDCVTLSLFDLSEQHIPNPGHVPPVTM